MISCSRFCIECLTGDPENIQAQQHGSQHEKRVHSDLTADDLRFYDMADDRDRDVNDQKAERAGTIFRTLR